jgi:hypothetical protein
MNHGELALLRAGAVECRARQENERAAEEDLDGEDKVQQQQQVTDDREHANGGH